MDQGPGINNLLVDRAEEMTDAARGLAEQNATISAELNEARQRIEELERKLGEAQSEIAFLSDSCHNGECRACDKCYDRVEKERNDFASRFEAEQRAHAKTADELAQVKASLQRQVTA